MSPVTPRDGRTSTAARTDMNDPSAQSPTRPAEKARPEFLNYFGKDRWIHVWLAEKRTRFFAAVFPPLVRLGLVPDTISYIGLALLVGVILYFVRSPLLACLFLAGNLVCDALDGSYARHTGKASQAGAFTDLVCDQVGMLSVAIMAVFHHLVSPLLGMVYIALYLIVVVFGVIINVMGLRSRITITSKYLLYIVFGIWAYWEVNYFTPMMSLFSAVMTVEVVVGYFRLKRGIRKKYDTPVRFTEGDPYSSRLNYALNVAVPVGVLAAVLVGANLIPISAFFDEPKLQVHWQEGELLLSEGEPVSVEGIGARDGRLLVMIRDTDDVTAIREYHSSDTAPLGSFLMPQFFDSAFDALPVDGSLLLVGDRTTHLLLGVDLDASFRLGRAVIVFTLPMEHLRVTAMAVAELKGKKVWLAANYLYTRKTYIIDPEKALKKGSILGGVVGAYVNAAFPAGMTSFSHLVVELNRIRSKAILYAAPLSKLAGGAHLLDRGKISFLPPAADFFGPVTQGDALVMLSPRGRVYQLPLEELLPHQGLRGKTSDETGRTK